MKLLLLNPPHPAIGSRIPHEHLPPLGLLAIGGPLIDAGHTVKLLDADFGPLSVEDIVAAVGLEQPDVLLLGHSGSTSGHPAAVSITRAIRRAYPRMWIVYGGVFPTYHYDEIMAAEPQIDFIVRGEGEEIVVRLISALECRRSLAQVRGIVYREGVVPGRFRQYTAAGQGTVIATGLAPVIQDLDTCRIAWELIDFSRYTYWGDKRAVVVQFSRGCPHRCSYCGQREFWHTWRHRDPVRFASELARLYREHVVQVINFADENPTASKSVWCAFLKALIAENVPMIMVGSTRASDIVRDADILSLYKQAGVARLLMGIESTDEQTLHKIRKGSTTATDREAIRLLRQHGIISMAACVAGFANETDRDYWRLLRQIISYDPDQIQALYATPHRWTPFATQGWSRRVIQTDLSRWDYKHQVLASERMPPWRVLIWMKFIEAVAQLRPKSLWRVSRHPDPAFRAAMQWYYEIGRKVWPYELWHWLSTDRRIENGPTVAEFLGITRTPATAKEGSAELPYSVRPRSSPLSSS
jgi:anaerobic magnesium-protoporphyrin IX monomethyl ester cyclase